jgi:hypothetical protein
MNIDSQGQVTYCIDHLENPAGNILFDPLEGILARLEAQQRENACHGCWTSCRGTAESLMYGGHFVRNILDYHRMTRPVPLVR